VAQAVDLYRDPGFDFSDLMIATAGRPLGAFSLATFDNNAARIEGATRLSA
jgi:predicted nucleic-acid-binding protein